jgi:phosphatidylglycerophosphatase C
VIDAEVAMNLALFDFDGTITFRDSFQPFLLYAATPSRKLFGTIALLPLLIGYKLGFVSATKTRQAVAGFAFRGLPLVDIERLGGAYARDVIPVTLRTKALDRIRWHKAQGDRVLIVSAALCVYLRAWCREMELEVICTEFETSDGMITGRYRMTNTGRQMQSSTQQRRSLYQTYP